MLDQYTSDQLKEIIVNIAPSGLIEWAEYNGKDLTDSQILMKYRFYMDCMIDYFTENGSALREILKSRKDDHYTKEEVIAEIMKISSLSQYEAKRFVDREW